MDPEEEGSRLADKTLDLAYMICTTPRTGSTVLLGMLRKTAVAGYPVEYPDSIYYKGVYGVMIQMGQTTTNFDLPPAERYGYIHLFREDVVAQAVSLTIASQTGRWHSYHSAKREPVYDSEGISLAVQKIQQDNLAWTTWLEDKSPVLRISYETLSSDYIRGTLRILGFLGLPKRAVEPPLSKVGTDRNIEWAERWKEENK